MREFFQSWRRKAGVVTLVMALLVMGGWIRSRIVKDEVSICQGSGITTHFISNRSRLGWKTVTIEDPSVRLTTTFYFSKPAEENSFYRGSQAHWVWRWRWCGFEFGRFIPDGPPWYEDIWIMPYWSLTVPLTLLSAYLVLWKPRKAKSSDQPANSN